MVEFRNVVDRVENDFEYGHRETRSDASGEWVRVNNSDHVHNLKRFWFQKAPHVIMLEDMGFETSKERANEFAAASDNDPTIWYYLAVAASYGAGAEALKWVMGSLAAEVNSLDLSFAEMPSLLPASYLGLFSKAIVDGRIDRTFTKAIFAELLKLPRESGSIDANFQALIDRPEYKPVSSDDLEPIIDQVIAANAEQFEKAKTNPKLVQFFVGQVMKATQGKAPPPKVIEIMNRKLA